MGCMAAVFVVSVIKVFEHTFIRYAYQLFECMGQQDQYNKLLQYIRCDVTMNSGQL